MADTCYFCDALPTSREHVPPACIFPEPKDLPDGIDYRKNLVTVPSCDAHNSGKSLDDAYIQLILVFGYFNNAAGKAHFNGKVIRALTRRPAILAALCAKQKPVVVDAQPTFAVDIDRARFNRAIERICQGLYVSKTGKKWPRPIDIHTPLLLSMDEPESDKINQLVTTVSKAAEEYLKDSERLGDNPDIFWYQLHVDESKDRLICRLVFYGGFDIFAISDPRLRAPK